MCALPLCICASIVCVELFSNGSTLTFPVGDLQGLKHAHAIDVVCRYAAYVLGNYSAYRSSLPREAMLKSYRNWSSDQSDFGKVMRQMCNNMNDYAEAVDTSRVVARTRRAQLKDAVAAHRANLDGHHDLGSESSLSSVDDDDGQRYEPEIGLHFDEEDTAAFLERTLERNPVGDRYTNEALASTLMIDDEYVR